MKKFITLILALCLITSVVSVKAEGLNKSNTFPLLHSSYDDEADIMREEIINSPSIVKQGNTTFYISPKGNDSNDGKSPNSPWKTTDNLWNYDWFRAGDAVLFERGGIYFDAHFILLNGVSYGAYGEGAKPKLYGTKKNYVDGWEATQEQNIWKIKLDDDVSNIGNIVFNETICAIFCKENNLVKDYQFYEDRNTSTLYLYFSKGNPQDYFENIYICDGRHILSAGPNKNIHVDNLCLKYTGAHGISFGDGTQNDRITNCEVGYIGGSELEGFANFVRYGNGIEFYGNSKGVFVENCYVYQCYDAGITCQGSNSVIADLSFANNLVEYCQYCIEIWVGDEALKYNGVSSDNSRLENCVFEDNVLRFAGFNFEYNNRFGSNTSAAACITAFDFCLPCDSRTVIRNNVFDTSYRYLVSIVAPNSDLGPQITGNVWITNSFSSDEKDVLGNLPTTACVGQTRVNNDRTNHLAGSLSQMKHSVGIFDLSPKEVVYDGDKYVNCHQIGDWEITKKPSCAQAGERVKKCIYCEKVFEKEEIEKESHSYKTVNAQDSSCGKDGYTGDTVCEKCNHISSYGKTVAKKEHSPKTVNAIAPSYTQQGNTGVVFCENCNQVLSFGNAVPVLQLKTPKITLQVKGRKATVKYKKIKGASKYEIRIKMGKKWKKKYTKKLKYTFKNLKAGKYKIKVRAVVEKNYSKFSKTKTIKIKRHKL